MQDAARLPLPGWALALFTLGCVDYQVERRPNIDSWTQPSRDSGVDILWVVDNSCSMSEEQEQLGLHATSFVSFLSNAAVDFRLVVTTTDPDPKSLPFDYDPVTMTADTADLATVFAASVEVGTEGDRDERGFDFALEALTEHPDLRKGADLEIVFFSDEDDYSEIGPIAFVNELQAMRQGKAIAVNAVVGDLPEGCASLLAAADAGVRYIDAQEESGGLRESICSADYAALLERIALKVLGLERRFALSEVPELDTLEVRVDDALIPNRERHGWVYDPGNNWVEFDGYAVPPPGSTVSLSYFPWLGDLNASGDSGADSGEETP